MCISVPPHSQCLITLRAFSTSLGRVEAGTVVQVEVKVTDQEKARQGRMNARPPLSEVLNLHDFEVSSTPFTLLE